MSRGRNPAAARSVVALAAHAPPAAECGLPDPDSPTTPTRAALRFLLLTAFTVSAGRAQELSVQVVDSAGVPLGLTSVVIRPTSGDSAATIRRLTSAAGTLRQALRPGGYMVIARRVGFRADSARVRADSLAAPVVLRLARMPQLLLTMVVRATEECALDEGENATGNSELWDEMLKGIEARRLLAESYRFESRVHRVITQNPSMGTTRVRTTDTVEVNDPRRPDSSRVRYRAGGYTASSGNRTSIRVFDEGDLTQAPFLRFHCHGAPWRDTTDGSVRMGLAPRRGMRGSEQQNLVRGTILKLSAVFGLRSLLASWTIERTHGAFERVPDSLSRPE